ncbi:MAG: hemerythrin domain-containing protein [Burkholderiales bacterium]|nr:hemerythrin domain-containing protein [Burkholderiales bacterium]
MLQTEIERTQALQPAIAAPRLDLYQGIHKAMRAMMADTLAALGAADAADDASMEQALAKLEELIALCAGHLDHENRFVHPAIEARRPGVTHSVAEDHLDHETSLDELRAGMRAVRRASGVIRAAVLDRLYRRLALFVADNFVHMEREEEVHNAALWDAYTDAELAGVHDRIVAGIPPAKMMAYLRWIIPSVPHGERVGMLAGMQQNAPEGVFEAQLDIARSTLPQAEWIKLATALNFSPLQTSMRS